MIKKFLRQKKFLRNAKIFRGFEKGGHTCLLTSYMDHYFSQGVEENGDKFKNLMDIDDPLMDILVLQRCQFSDTRQSFDQLENLSKKLSQKLMSYYHGKDPATLNPNLAEEILHMVQTILANRDKKFSEGDLELIQKSLQAVYSIFVLLDKRAKGKLYQILTITQEKTRGLEGVSQEFERQVNIGFQLYKNFSILTEDQVQKFYKMKLGIEKKLELEPNLELFIDDDVYYIVDKEANNELEINFMSDFRTKEQLLEIKDRMESERSGDLNNFVVESSPYFIPEEEMKVLKKSESYLNLLVENTLNEFKFKHHITSNNVQEFYLKHVFDEEHFSEEAETNIFYSQVQDREKSIAIQTTLLANHLGYLNTQESINIFLSGYLDEERNYELMSRLDQEQADYLLEMSSLLNILNLRYVYNKGKKNGCLKCNPDFFGSGYGTEHEFDDEEVQDIHLYTSKIYRHSLIDDGISGLMNANVLYEASKRLSGSESHKIKAYFSNHSLLSTIENFVELSKRERLDGYSHLESFERKNHIEKLKEKYMPDLSNEFIDKLTSLETFQGFTEPQIFNFFEKKDKHLVYKFTDYQTLMETKESKLSINEWNFRYPLYKDEDFESKCLVESIVDYNNYSSYEKNRFRDRIKNRNFNRREGPIKFADEIGQKIFKKKDSLMEKLNPLPKDYEKKKEFSRKVNTVLKRKLKAKFKRKKDR